MTQLTDEQHANLEKLAAYLEGLPADYTHFNMVYWIVGANANEARYALRNGGVQSCGTAACACGHGPAAGILVPPEMVVAAGVDWYSYSTKSFVSDRDANAWCFGGSWKYCDNSHFGAAARIRYMLDKGVPDKFGWPGDYDTFVKLYAPYRIDASLPDQSQ